MTWQKYMELRPKFLIKQLSERFPAHFRFQLTEIEVDNLRSQIVTSREQVWEHGGRRYLPYAFTEQGIAMLSAVLRSKTAVQVSIGKSLKPKML